MRPVLPDRAVAAELFTTAVCNLDCKYCYIPKVKSMKYLHFDLIKKIKSKQYITELERLYGNNLEILSLWGAEPTMSLREVSSIMPDLMAHFPKLSELSFSTNFLTDINIIKDFILSVPELRSVKFSIQISLDGPEEIVGKNRMKGAAQRITDNLLLFLDWLATLKTTHTFKLTYKPTITRENINWLLEENNVYNYYKFFDELDEKLSQYSLKNVSLPLGGALISVEVPGNYTSFDGRQFAKLVKKINSIHGRNNFKWYTGYLTAYHYRLLRILKYGAELFTKASMFTCSGGRSNFGVGNERVHICHRGMFLSDDRYVEAVKNMPKNHDFELIRTGAIDRFREYYSPQISNADDIARFTYTLAARHNSSLARLSAIVALLNELVEAGQALKKYKSHGELKLIHMFLMTAFDCPADGILRTASVNVQNLSIIRLMANGAFEHIRRQVWNHIEKKTLN